MNQDVLDYVTKHKDKIAGYILEVGSYDHNGSVRSVTRVDIGIDMRPGKGVDKVMLAEDLPNYFQPEEFDTVICCDMMEHCEHWREAIEGMWHVLRMDGWLIFTMASMRKGRHDYPSDFWRCPPERLKEIFPGCQDLVNQKVSINLVVQKKGNLPDLSKIEMLPVDTVRKT